MDEVIFGFVGPDLEVISLFEVSFNQRESIRVFSLFYLCNASSVCCDYKDLQEH